MYLFPKFKKLTNILLFLILFLSLNCFSSEIRLQNPADSNDAKNQTLVGFIILDDISDNAQEASNSSINVHPILSTGMVIHDVQTKDRVESLLINQKPIETVEANGEKISYAHRIETLTPTFNLDSRKDYYLGYMQWERFCNYCSKPTTYKINFEPQKSISTLKIKGKPGEIVFLGIYRVSVTRENFNFSDFVSNKTKKIDYAFERILPNSPFWQKDLSEYGIWSRFDQENGYNERSAEIKFLKTIIELQQKGYWKEKAEKRLNELLNSK